jgi:cytochrome b561
MLRMETYPTATRFFHWAIALLLLVQIPLAWYMIELPLGAEKFARYGLHKSLGMTLFTLAVIRLVRAILIKGPSLPADTKLYEKVFARITQGILYLLLVVMPITGWLMSSAANVPVILFGMIELPSLVAPNKEFMEGMQNVHEMQSYLLLALITVHLLGGLKHQFLLKNNVLYSMLPIIGKR